MTREDCDRGRVVSDRRSADRWCSPGDLCSVEAQEDARRAAKVSRRLITRCSGGARVPRRLLEERKRRATRRAAERWRYATREVIAGADDIPHCTEA